MGISGLLPALKTIQVTKPLSEFAGQTLAVDAYVWLHRGVLSCATELATGKDTHKYVDYAMHRVRLLRHYQIEPYIVFDGGPLPAKKGTETERKQRREESLARGKALAAQGKHSQARECFVKCVDVTPQMAFQFIKALRAESVLYVVAPYEADAQLAYLERIKLVDGIITEDSDLLVFGCRNVLFKFDMVARSVVSIERKNFASVTSSATDTSSISLIGWSDKQFRAMAILSGCDYLPSIPGIGLKTACSMLRKWKTVEQIVRVISLEGKKSVPKGYLKQFNLAEKCFLHQRVYCPNQEKLVHLTEVDEAWDDEAEAYVGSDLDPSLAKNIALGDVDPASLLPMKDINPNYVPRAIKPRPPISKSNNQKDKGKEKAKSTPVKEGILSFFGPTPKIPPLSERRSSTPIKPLAGKASGKRTLAEVMDQDMAKKQNQRSKFFHPFASPTPKNPRKTPGDKRTSRDRPTPVAGPSRLSVSENKENVYIVIDDDDDEVEEVSGVSMVAQGKVDLEMLLEIEDPSCYDVVEQEDGYLSPTPSTSGDIQDLSSPIQPGHTSVRRECNNDLDFGAEAVSSPPSQAKRSSPRITPRQPNRTRSLDVVTVKRARRGLETNQLATFSASFPDPDLRHCFADERASDIDASDQEAGDTRRSGSSPTPTPSPLTPTQECSKAEAVFDDDVPTDPEDAIAKEDELRKQAVATGWRERWALNNVPVHSKYEMPKLLRRETNVTPAGRHSVNPHSRFRPYPSVTPRSAPSKTAADKHTKPRRAQSRKSLPFYDAAKPGSPDVVLDDEVVLPTPHLQLFRCR